MNNIFRSCSLAIGFIFSAHALSDSGWLAYDAYIKVVGNNGGNNDSYFGVVVEGGSGPCNNAGKTGNLRGWIEFRQTNGISDTAFKNLYAMALTSQVSRNKVRIYSYNNYPECHTAIAMELH